MSTRSAGSGLVAIAIAAVLLTQGCTLIGLGIGATTPKYERVEPPYDSLAVGTDVRVLRADRDPDDAVTGEYRGPHGRYLFIDTEWGGRAVDERNIAEVQRRSGSYWAEGLAVGVALDVIAGSLLAVEIANSSRFHFSVGPWN